MKKKTIACRTCRTGRSGRIYHCVVCGIEACSHTIRPQTPRGQPEVGRCHKCNLASSPFAVHSK